MVFEVKREMADCGGLDPLTIAGLFQLATEGGHSSTSQSKISYQFMRPNVFGTGAGPALYNSLTLVVCYSQGHPEPYIMWSEYRSFD